VLESQSPFGFSDRDTFLRAARCAIASYSSATSSIIARASALVRASGLERASSGKTPPSSRHVARGNAAAVACACACADRSALLEEGDGVRKSALGIARARRNRKSHTLELGSGSTGSNCVQAKRPACRDLHHNFGLGRPQRAKTQGRGCHRASTHSGSPSCWNVGAHQGDHGTPPTTRTVATVGGRSG
jgi:hypothetical protein